MYTCNYLGSSHVDDLVATFMTLKVIKSQVRGLQHCAHCAIRNNNARFQGLAQATQRSLEVRQVTTNLSCEQLQQGHVQAKSNGTARN